MLPSANKFVGPGTASMPVIGCFPFVADFENQPYPIRDLLFKLLISFVHHLASPDSLYQPDLSPYPCPLYLAKPCRFQVIDII